MIRQNPSIFSSKQAAGTKVVCLVVGRSFVGERLGVPYFVVVAQF
jgi:hypothetical protein